MSTEPRNAIRPAVLTLTLLALTVPALAEESGEVAELSRPESEISAGIGYLTDDSRRFGQYTGLDEKGGYGLLDIDIANRDDASGTWVLFEGRNLGLDNRDLRFEHRRQGDWGYFLEYSQMPRLEPYTPTTAVTGIGTPNLGVPVPGASGDPVELKTTRDLFGFGADKALAEKFDVQLRYQQQEKNGARIFGRGTPGAAGFQFIPEPINSTTRMIETTLGYTDRKLQLSGGYYGTLYENHNPALSITEFGAGAPSGLSGFSPMALPPDNQAHQLFVAAGYSLTDTTRTTFKAAYTHARQTHSFIVPSPATGRTDLGGEVDTTLLQAGLTARPLPKLSVLANLRHENRDDKTPVVDYFAVTTGTTFTGENEPRSIKTNAARLEATYALPLSLRMTGGVDYDQKERNHSEVRVVSARTDTREMSYRLALRRTISETLTGSLGVTRSQREGSEFLTTRVVAGTPGSNLIAPIHYADRERDKLRLALNWMPVEMLSVQLVADSARDDYQARTAENLGPREGLAENYALDATLVFSEEWQLTAWVARNRNRMDQASCESANATGVCPIADPYWQVSLRNLGNSGGLGLRAKPFEKLELGADLQHSVYDDEYRQRTTTAGAVATAIPDIETRVTTIRLNARYALTRNAGVRFDYAFQRWTSDDWTWTTWTYTDGTRLLQEPVQKVHFFGISGYYRWW